MDYIQAHFRGEHSLSRSFWVNYFLTSLAVGWSVALLEGRVTEITLGMFAAAALAVWLGALIGTWRSATRVGGWWSAAARVLLALHLLFAVDGFIEGYSQVQEVRYDSGLPI